MFIAGCFAFAVALGWMISRKLAFGAAVILLTLLVYILAFSPEIAPAFALFASYDFLGFADPHTFARIPGIFKLRDLLLFAVVFFSLINILLSRRVRDVLSPLAVRAALAYTAYVLAMIAYTAITGHGTMNLALRTSSTYFYYLIMIPVIAFVSSRKKLNVFLWVLLVMALIPEVLAGFQIATHKPIFSYATVLWINVGGFSLPRNYVLSFNLTGAALLSLFGIYLYSGSPRLRTLSALSGFVLLVGVVLTFGRAFWMGMLGAVVFLFVAVYAETKQRDVILLRTIRLWAGTAAVIALVLIFAVITAKESSLTRLSGVVGQRFVSTFSDITELGGTFGWRLQDSAFRIQLFKQNPLLGAGYVHRTSEFASELPKKDVATTDSGIFTILAQSGIVGVAFVGALIVIFMKHGLHVFRRLRDPILKGISIGIVAFYVHAIITLVGLTGIVFSYYAGICTVGLLVGLQEVMLRIDEANH